MVSVFTEQASSQKVDPVPVSARNRDGYLDCGAVAKDGTGIRRR